jgi:hypothetical protein
MAGKRSQATTRSASAIATPDERGPVRRDTAYSMRPRRIPVATAAARSDTPNFS